MDPVQYALNNLRHKIPAQVLQLVFGPQQMGATPMGWGYDPSSHNLDHNIYERVLLSRVHPDLNLFGSMQVRIPLQGLEAEYVDYQTRVYRIPYERTDGHRLVGVQSLHYTSSQYGLDNTMGHSYAGGGESSMTSAAGEVVDSVSDLPISQTARLQIIGDNVVMVRDSYQHYSHDAMLVGICEFDDLISQLNPGAYPVYAELVEYATKAYIYNHLVVMLDQGALHAGMELGRIRELVDDYRDANELYQQTYNERWKVTAFTNDRPRMSRYISGMIRP